MAPLFEDQGADTGGPLGKLYVRTAVASTPALSIGGTQDVVMSWSPPFPSADYTVPQPGITGTTTVLGKVSCQVKDGSKTVSGCTITVTNTGLAGLGLGAGIIEMVAYLAT